MVTKKEIVKLLKKLEEIKDEVSKSAVKGRVVPVFTAEFSSKDFPHKMISFKTIQSIPLIENSGLIFYFQGNGECCIRAMIGGIESKRYSEFVRKANIYFHERGLQ